MFRVSRTGEARRVTTPVTIQVPQNGGTTTGFDVEVTYKLPPQDELDQQLEGLKEGDDSIDLAKQYVETIDKVADEDGHPLPADTATRDLVLNITYARAAIMAAFWLLVNGKAVKARRGN